MDTQVPENLNDLDADALIELKAKLDAEFDSKYEDDADLAELGEIADAVDSVRGTIETKAAEKEKAEADREALRNRVHGSEADDEAAEEAALDAEAEADDASDADATDDAAAAAESDDTDDAEASDADATDDADEKELVTASAAKQTRKPAPRRGASASGLARRQPTPAPQQGTSPELVITASADVPGFGNGQTIDRVGIARAMHARARGLGDSRGVRAPFNVASINSPIPEHLMVRDANADLGELMDTAVAEKLSGSNAAALVASGGWCAPSEVMYDMFSVESADGLIDLPTVGVTRGGVQYPEYMGIDVTNGALWTWTEANDETPGSDGDPTKPCIQVPCPTWVECRLTAEGLCVTAGNLQDRANPEGTARFVDLVMTAHLHRLSNAKIAAIVGTADAVTVTSIESDAAGDILNAIDLQVADFRSEHLMSESVVLDGVFPQWFIEAIRATLAARAGVNLLSVSNAQVREFFTDRNVRPQFVAGYSPLFNTAPATAWPSTATFLLMPTGGYTVADGGQIDLGVMRDSTLNETNDFTAAWSEQFYCVMQRGPAAREVTVTTDVDGVTACCPVV